MAERRSHVVAAAADLLPALLQHRQRFRPKRRERRVLRRCGRTNECVRRELFDLPNVDLRTDDPSQPPAVHIVLLRAPPSSKYVVVQLQYSLQLTLEDPS